ncbi:MAG: SPFH domain-containing protein [Candidatus Paceibacterota bacterium]|jgi:regulator of protease activity HflC (stomatin/prohibitin superfamily)
MYYLIFIICVIIASSIRQVNQYERGVKFMFGKFHAIMNPGWRIVWPIIQTYQKIDLRTKAVDVPDQNAITKDNVPVNVNAVIYYKVVAADQAILEIENFKYAIMQYAQTTMRNVVGEVTLDELLASRDRVANRIEELVEIVTAAWGISVSSVELKDVKLPENMERTIAKQAEAEREKRAVIITSEGELAASQNMAKAAATLSAVPGALHLRTLQSINDISSDASNTVVFTLPLETIQAFTGYMKDKTK